MKWLLLQSDALNETMRDEAAKISALSADDMIQRFIDGSVDLVFKAIGALIVFYIGKFIIKRLYNIVTAIMLRRDADQSLTTFVLSLVRIVLYFILLITIVGIMGLETSSFLAIFASAGVAVGMALSGTLQNFAGGVLILLLKPYKIGDYIEAQGFAGTVTEIQIFHTIINTYDNKSIIIPNGGLSTGTVNNWSRETYRRVAWDVAISYGDDIDTARKAIMEIFADDSRIFQKPVDDNNAPAAAEDADETPAQATDIHGRVWRMFHRHQRKVKGTIQQWDKQKKARVAALKPNAVNAPSVVVNELADNSVNLQARAWTRSENYWGVFYDINEKIYKRLPQAGIHFPFPQLDVHLSREQ
jgi:small conductance mechanosensitive channel